MSRSFAFVVGFALALTGGAFAFVASRDNTRAIKRRCATTQCQLQSMMTRRDLGSVALLTILLPPNPAAAQVFTRETDQFAYEFQPPENFGAGNKPLRTHLDEINFKSESVAGYQYGITVDPVRIESLRQFGTPQEVAAKVVLAEVNRDGVFDVTLMADPQAGPNDSFYQLNYQSKGKRGNKRFVAKFYIEKQKLYAMTAQCKEDDFAALESEMLKAAESFRVL